MNLLPLDSFRRIVGYNPWLFWGLATNSASSPNAAPVNSACNTALSKYSYQNQNQFGREDIAQALEEAESRLLTYLQYSVAPHYKDVTLPYPIYLDQRLIRTTPIDPRGRWISIMLQEGYVQAVGIETTTLVATVAVTYSDEDGDGLDETFTITTATTETDATKFAVYFAAADRFDSTQSLDYWRIQPVSVSISGGNVTIVGKAWLLVEPVLYEGYTNPPVPLDPTVSTNFVTTLSIYTRTTNPNGTTISTSQGRLNWETQYYPSWATCCAADNSTDPAAVAYAIARVGIRDAEKGFVIPGEVTYNATTDVWTAVSPQWDGLCRPPSTVTVRYLAGKALDSNGLMDKRHQVLDAVLAMAEMPERIFGCDVANRTLTRWQQPLNRTGTTQETFAVTRRILDNPLGDRRGHLFAWSEIQDLRLVRGASGN